MKKDKRKNALYFKSSSLRSTSHPLVNRKKEQYYKKKKKRERGVQKESKENFLQRSEIYQRDLLNGI